MENKNILQKRSLIEQGRHLALEVLTLEMAYVGREKGNTRTKQH
jgi:hypothetical protein